MPIKVYSAGFESEIFSAEAMTKFMQRYPIYASFTINGILVFNSRNR